MDKSRRSQSPHKKLAKKSIKAINKKSVTRRKSLLALVSSDDVTEGSLQVWRGLPSKIRDDPSLAPFHVENERIHGQMAIDSLSAQSISVNENDFGNDVIRIHVTNEDGVDRPLDEISTTRNNSSISNMTIITNNTSMHSMKPNKNPWRAHAKLIFLFSIWLLSMAFMTTEDEKTIHQKLLSIDAANVKREYHILGGSVSPSRCAVSFHGRCSFRRIFIAARLLQ